MRPLMLCRRKRAHDTRRLRGAPMVHIRDGGGAMSTSRETEVNGL
jgi:hypothetical protein